MAVYQPAYWQLTHRYRGQAPSHIGYANRPEVKRRGQIWPQALTHLTLDIDQTVGGGLPPMAVDQSACWQLTHRYREQAPSHIGYANRPEVKRRGQIWPQALVHI